MGCSREFNRSTTDEGGILGKKNILETVPRPFSRLQKKVLPNNIFSVDDLHKVSIPRGPRRANVLVAKDGTIPTGPPESYKEPKWRGSQQERNANRFQTILKELFVHRPGAFLFFIFIIMI